MDKWTIEMVDNIQFWTINHDFYGLLMLVLVCWTGSEEEDEDAPAADDEDVAAADYEDVADADDADLLNRL